MHPDNKPGSECKLQRKKKISGLMLAGLKERQKLKHIQILKSFLPSIRNNKQLNLIFN